MRTLRTEAQQRGSVLCARSGPAADAFTEGAAAPGMTGLSRGLGARIPTPSRWVETLRFDLYYVDNWSLAMGPAIVLKTVDAVIRGSGA